MRWEPFAPQCLVWERWAENQYKFSELACSGFWLTHSFSWVKKDCLFIHFQVCTLPVDMQLSKRDPLLGVFLFIVGCLFWLSPLFDPTSAASHSLSQTNGARQASSRSLHLPQTQDGHHAAPSLLCPLIQVEIETRSWRDDHIQVECPFKFFSLPECLINNKIYS